MDNNLEQGPVPQKQGKAWVWWVVAVLVVMAALGAAVLYKYKQAKQDVKTTGAEVKHEQNKAGSSQPQPAKESDKVFQATQEFPFYNGFGNAYFDAEDKNIVWLSFSGAIIKYDLQTDTWQAITATDGLDNEPNTLARKGDNIYFSLYQTGFEKLNIKTGQSKRFTVNEGLPNNANIKLYDDPGTPDIWLATFDGLSRFNTQTEKFINYKNELGIGTSWSINDVSVNKNYVWVVVGANAYNPGSIARYDKQANSWRYWGPQAFGADQRVDVLYGIDSLGGKALANVSTTGNSSGDRIMEFNPATDKWETVLKNKYDAYRGINYLVDGVYMLKDNELYFADFKSNQPVPLGVKLKSEVNYKPGIVADHENGRLLLLDWPQGVYLYDSATKTAKTLNFKEQDKLLSKLIAVGPKTYAFQNLFGFVLVDLSANTTKPIPYKSFDSYQNFSGKIIGDTLVMVLPGMGGMDGCDPNKLLFVDLKENVITKDIDVPDFCMDSAYIGRDLSQIYLVNSSLDKDPYKKYNPQTGSFDEVAANKNLLAGLEQVFAYNMPIVWSADGQISAEAVFDQSGISPEKILINNKGQTETVELLLKSAYTDGFGRPAVQKITSLAFDASGPLRLLIGTDQGLIIYDVAAKKQTVAGKEEGLLSLNISKIISLPDRLILVSPTGAYVYKADFNKIK